MKPWIRMYRAERGSFAQLPLVARGIAMEILKLTDDSGRIQLGNKSPVDAIAFALGATRADRRALAQYVPILLADGFLILEGSILVVPNFARFQGDDGATKRPRTDNDGATVEPRTDHEPTTTAQRTDNESEPKCAESNTGTDCALIREEEIREDKTRGREEYAREGSAVYRTYVEHLGRRAARFDTATPDKLRASALADTELRRTAALRSTTADALLSVALDRWFADPWAKSKGYPFEVFARQVTRLATADAAAATKVRGQAPPATHAEHAAAVAQAIAEGRPHGEGWADVGI